MQPIKLETRRWFILFTYCYFQFVNQQSWNNYSPIITTSATYYNTSEENIIWFINSWYVSYAVLALFTIPIFLWRFDVAMYLGTILNAIGAWVRYGAFQNFGIAMLGNLIISFAQLFTLAAPPFVAERFFGVEERDLSNGIGYFSGLLGIAVGFLVPCFVINDDDTKMEPFFLYSSIVMTIPILFVILFVRNKPKYPASNSSITTKLPFFKSIKTIFFNLKNLIILICFTIYQGISWAFSTAIAYILSPQGYEIYDLGYIGIVMSSAGTVAGLGATMYLQKKLKKNEIPPYDWIIRILVLLQFIPLCVIAFVLYYSTDANRVLIYIMCALMGIGFNAFVPIAIQSYVETLFPVDELIFNTSFQIMSNLLGFGATVAIVDPAVAEYGLLIISGCMVPIAIYLLFFYKTQLNRLKVENLKIETVVDNNNINDGINAQKYQQVDKDCISPIKQTDGQIKFTETEFMVQKVSSENAQTNVTK